MNQDMIIIIDMGSTENSALARMIRGMGVYCEIQPHDITPEHLQSFRNVKGLIFNGGKNREIDGVPVSPQQEIIDYPIPELAFGCPDFPEINLEEIDEGTVRSFLFNTCRCRAEWNMEAFIQEQIELLKKQIGDERVLLALSGGVDSSVVAALLIKAIGDRLTCIHVNHGLLRKDEPEQVVRVFKDELGAN